MSNKPKKKKLTDSQIKDWKPQILKWVKEEFGGDIKRAEEALRSGKGVKDAAWNKAAMKVIQSGLGTKKIEKNDTIGKIGEYVVNFPLTALGMTGAAVGEGINAYRTGEKYDVSRVLGLTNDGQMPASKALDIKNPVGAFTVDMLTDLSTYTGSGAIKRLGNLKNLLNPKKIVKTNREAETINRVFDKPGLVQYKNDAGRLPTTDTNIYRKTGKSQVDDIIKDGWVRPREGGQYGDQMYWSRGNKSFFYPSGDSGQYILSAKSDIKNGHKGALSLQDLDGIYTPKNGKFENILENVINQRKGIEKVNFNPAGVTVGAFNSIPNLNKKETMLKKGGVLNGGKEYYQQLLAAYAKEKGIDASAVDREIERIAYHESKGDYGVSQKGGGPGRGGLQFEVGENNGASTARARLIDASEKEYGLKVPDEIYNIDKNNYDVSTLSPEHQKALFLGNIRRHPKADFSSVVKGDTTAVDFWGKYHQTTSDPIKMERFKQDSIKFNEMKKLPKGKNGMELVGDIGNIASLAATNPYAAAGLFAIKSISGTIDGAKEARANSIPKITESKNPFMNYMKKGGELDSTIIGQSHENGGTKINKDGIIDPNTAVAEVEKNEKLHKYKYTEKSNSTYIFPTNMKASLEKIEKKLRPNDFIDRATKDVLFSEKQNENEKKKMMEQTAYLKKGGNLPKYGDGNPLYDPNVQGQPFGMEYLNKLKGLGATMGMATTGFLTGTGMNSTVPTATKSAEPIKSPVGKDIQGVMGSAGLQTLANSVTGLSAIADAKEKPYYNPNTAEIRDNARQLTQYDNAALQDQIQSSLNKGIADIGNNTRSTGTSLGNKQALYSNLAKQKADIELSKQNTMANRIAQSTQILQSEGAARAQADFVADTTTDQNRAAGVNIVNQGFKDNVEIQKALYNYNNHHKSSDLLAKTLSELYPDFTFDPADMKKIREGMTIEELEQIVKKRQ